MVAMTEIETFAMRIAKDFDPDKIILFGSYADGTASPDSDVDVLVILPFIERNLDKSVEILTKSNPSFPVDLLARNPTDISERYRMGDPLVRSAIDHGLVLYERAA